MNESRIYFNQAYPTGSKIGNLIFDRYWTAICNFLRGWRWGGEEEDEGDEVDEEKIWHLHRKGYP